LSRQRTSLPNLHEKACIRHKLTGITSVSPMRVSQPGSGHLELRAGSEKRVDGGQSQLRTPPKKDGSEYCPPCGRPPQTNCRSNDSTPTRSFDPLRCVRRCIPVLQAEVNQNFVGNCSGVFAYRAHHTRRGSLLRGESLGRCFGFDTRSRHCRSRCGLALGPFSGHRGSSPNWVQSARKRSGRLRSSASTRANRRPNPDS
jgi:hypothetical protein